MRARIKTTADGGKVARGAFWYEVQVGTTQGGVDSMQLFCALIDDLESELATAGVRGVQFIVNSESQQVRNLDFADDVTLLVEFEEDLQLALDAIQSFYIKRKLTPNPKKCELIVFDPKKRNLRKKRRLLETY